MIEAIRPPTATSSPSRRPQYDRQHGIRMAHQDNQVPPTWHNPARKPFLHRTIADAGPARNRLGNGPASQFSPKRGGNRYCEVNPFDFVNNDEGN